MLSRRIQFLHPGKRFALRTASCGGHSADTPARRHPVPVAGEGGRACRPAEGASPESVGPDLSLLKYAVLAVVHLTWRTGELILRGFNPCYALISRHGEDITFWAYVVGGAVAAGSLLISLPFCRWFCPLAAVLNIFSRFGIARIQRDAHVCVDCGNCARACPMAIPVDKETQVTAARCTTCMACAAACPVREKGALFLSLPGSRNRMSGDS